MCTAGSQCGERSGGNPGKKVNAKGVLGVMGLGAKKGAEITVTVDGEDEEIAAAELETFLKENL